MKLLVISDLHYRGGGISELAAIIRKERPDHLVLLGDNIDPKELESVRLYKEFISLLSGKFSLKKTALMLGDEDYAHLKDKKAVLNYIKSLKTLNGKEEHFRYAIGNLLFSHGNVERSHSLEMLGKKIILFSVANNIHYYIPPLVSVWARLALLAGRRYLFIGHMHYLGKVGITRTTFCGTFNRDAKYFNENSLGYVVIEHSGFEISSMASIRIRRIAK